MELKLFKHLSHCDPYQSTWPSGVVGSMLDRKYGGMGLSPGLGNNFFWKVVGQIVEMGGMPHPDEKPVIVVTTL